MTHPLIVRCQNLSEIRDFICQCRYVSDKDQYQRQDYWTPPEEFEKLQQGDCDCFAIWVWRQLIDLGYEARFVGGRVGDAKTAHAWVMFRDKGEWYLLEPMYAYLSMEMPRLKAHLYRPKVSIGWDGEKPQFYEHEETSSVLSTKDYLSFMMEWVLYRARYTLKLIRLKRKYKEFRSPQPRKRKGRRKS